MDYDLSEAVRVVREWTSFRNGFGISSYIPTLSLFYL